MINLFNYDGDLNPSFVPSQLDSWNFMIFDNRGKFKLGKIEDEKGLLDDWKDFVENDFYGQRLMGQKFQGFYVDNKALKFCEIDLDSMERREIDVPIQLDDSDELEILNSQVSQKI